MPTRKRREEALSLRPVTIKKGVIKHAEGSAMITMGQTRVLCAATVEQGRPRWMQNQERQQGWVTAEYSLLPRSTLTRTRRERGAVSGRTQEIQRLIGRSLRAAIDLDALKQYTITVDCDVIQADGGTRTAAVTGAYVALYQACRTLYRGKAVESFPVIDQVAAISVGYYQGKLWLDLDYQHDKDAEVDMNVVMTGSGRLVEVQGTAEGRPFSRSQLDKMLTLAARGIRELISIQKKTLGIR